MRNAVVVLPTYNEAGNIEKIIPEIFAVAKETPNWEIHIIVVDSNSQDGTGDIVTKLMQSHKNLHLLHTKKEGLGKAYVNGFTEAIEKLNPYLMFEMDADLSHDPKEIPAFLHKIEHGADFVVGSRYMPGGSIPSDWGWHRKLFSGAGNLIIKLGFMTLKITDWTNGFRAIKTWVIKANLPHVKNYSGYVFQIAMLDNALKNNARIEEVPIKFKDRKTGVSKISFGQYIFTIFAYIFRHSSFVKFVIVGGIGFSIDFGLFYLLTHKADWVTWHANLLSTETAVVTNFFLNNFWSFKHRRVEHSVIAYLKNFLKFNLVSAGNILIQTIGVEILQFIFGERYILEYKVAIILFVVIPYSYFFYNKFIWKKK